MDTVTERDADGDGVRLFDVKAVLVTVTLADVAVDRDALCDALLLLACVPDTDSLDSDVAVALIDGGIEIAGLSVASVDDETLAVDVDEGALDAVSAMLCGSAVSVAVALADDVVLDNDVTVDEDVLVFVELADTVLVDVDVDDEVDVFEETLDAVAVAEAVAEDVDDGDCWALTDDVLVVVAVADAVEVRVAVLDAVELDDSVEAFEAEPVPEGAGESGAGAAVDVVITVADAVGSVDDAALAFAVDVELGNTVAVAVPSAVGAPAADADAVVVELSVGIDVAVLLELLVNDDDAVDVADAEEVAVTENNFDTELVADAVEVAVDEADDVREGAPMGVTDV